MRKITSYLFENQIYKCKISIFGDGAFQVAITQNDFYENPCFEPIMQEVQPMELDVDFKCKIAHNLFVKFTEDFSKIFVIRRRGVWELLLEISNIDLHLKEFDGKVCQGNSFSVKKEADEKFYGLGEHQNNVLNHNYSKVNVFHEANDRNGTSIGIPFLLSSKGYALINNTLAKSVVNFNMEESYTWSTDWAEDFSVYVFLGGPKKIYRDLANVTGQTPMPLKSSLGYIQSKNRYDSQEELLQVARMYKEKNYPIDMMVVDWMYWKNWGDLTMDLDYWPDPKEMKNWFYKNEIDTMISVSPVFQKGTDYYNLCLEKDWFIKDRKGKIIYNEDPCPGSIIDITIPECGIWFWNVVFENLGIYGYNAWWAHENIPELDFNSLELNVGKGYEVYNIYPYERAKNIYEGHRIEYGTRCLTLIKYGCLGSQRYGTQFWSSDIEPSWGELEKQVSTMINFCASGMGYWSSDIGGWKALPNREETKGKNIVELVDMLEEYPELYIRWFQFGVFCPILRAHGSREENEVWSFGRLAEQIMVSQLELRYRLMPYIYSMAYQLYTEGTPLVRGLFIEFPDDEKALEVKDEYMFGDALLVAPILELGQKKKKVYLPRGCAWYDFYSSEKYVGGKTIEVETKLSRIPVFVRENRIVPMGNPVKNTRERIHTLEVHVYGTYPKPFLLYEDDGRTCDYENGKYKAYSVEYKNEKVYFYGDDSQKDCSEEMPWSVVVEKR